MRSLFLGTIVLSLVLASGFGPGRLHGQNDPNIASSGPRTPEEERQGFHLPPGFEIQLVAAEPFVRKPINMNFDDRGRLWVTESIEYPFAAAKEARHRDTVRILHTTKGEGQADEVTTFADGLNIPIGVLPLSKGAIVYSIPNIDRLTDSHGGDRADQREVLMGSVGHKDTHGMTGEFTWGYDGWVYACHGYYNTSTITAKDGSKITMQSGNTYRFKPDGSHIEQWTWGQVNPFGLSFDPLGNLFSCDCHTRPAMLLLRGGHYDMFGKPHDGLGYAPEIMTHDHGSTAIAGITYYAADHFPPEYRDTLFIGNVVTNRINHDRLERHGSTLLAIQQPDFLVSDDPWFRPVDIKLGPDGALYVADFYNRIIGHYEVPLNHPGRDRERGRIWRIVYRGADGKGKAVQPRADWGKASVEELVQDLGHPNLVIRMKAANQLVERGGEAGVAAVQKILSGQASAFQRRHGLWVLERVGKLDDRLLTELAKDKDSGVRVHGMRVLADRRELPEALRLLVVEHLKDPDAFVQRAAAEALSTHPSAANLRPLLEQRHTVAADDTHLLHMVRMALRNQLLPKENWDKLPLPGWSERDARAVADIAPGVHSPEAAGFLLQQLQQLPFPREQQLRYVQHVARYGQAAQAEGLLDYARGDRAASLMHQVALFKTIQQGIQARGAPLSADGRAWGERLTRFLLTSQEDQEVVTGIELGSSLKMERVGDICAALVADKQFSEVQRTAAMAALVTIDPKKHVTLLARVLGDPSEPLAFRDRAANYLGKINQAEAQEELAKNLVVAPERLAVTIAVGLAASKPGVEKLLDTVATGKASPRLLQERQVEVLLNGPNGNLFKDKVAQLTRDLPTADMRVKELLTKHRDGFLAAKSDAGLGVKIFEKHCAICHQLANKGAKIGPQLDGVGIRGIERLLEDILDPNRNVDQAFRSTVLNLKSGQSVTGLMLREEGQTLVLGDKEGKEVRVAKDAVEERLVSPVSPMPANFVDQIAEPDLYHLLAFLLQQQPPKQAVAR